MQLHSHYYIPSPLLYWQLLGGKNLVIVAEAYETSSFELKPLLKPLVFLLLPLAPAPSLYPIC